MRALIAILSCARDYELETHQLATFLSGTGAEYKFFRGRGCGKDRPDVEVLDVEDDFVNLPFKTQAMCSWALEAGYDFIFKCDTDTYLNVERLLTSGFEAHDYSGFFSYEPGPDAYASGGPGYWLSKKAAELVVAAKLIEDPGGANGQQQRSCRGEDLQVGWALRDGGIACHKDERYRMRTPGPRYENPFITLHDVCLPSKVHRVPIADMQWRMSFGKPERVPIPYPRQPGR